MMYTDPGSGALLWQLGVSAFLGGVFYVSRVGHWIGRKLRLFGDTAGDTASEQKRPR